MEIQEEKHGGNIVVLGLKGRLDPTTVGIFEKKLVKVIEDGGKFVLLDFAGLDYVSSAGLRVLLTGAKRLKAVSGKIVLFSVKQYVKEVLDISGFSSIFSVCSSLAEAMTAIK
jgi:anti-sigma B factor antagonist